LGVDSYCEENPKGDNMIVIANNTEGIEKKEIQAYIEKGTLDYCIGQKTEAIHLKVMELLGKIEKGEKLPKQISLCEAECY